MSAQKGGFQELLFSSIMPKVYGIGAAVVIVGAMFKILHLPGASEMLGIGLSTEAVIFFLSAFEPKHRDPDWSKVYPELADDYEGPAAAPRKAVSGSNQGDGVSKKLDAMLESSNVGEDLIASLGKGMKNLAESAKGLTNVSNASVATSEYADNVKKASKSLVDLNASYSTTAAAVSEMANASKDAKEFHTQVQAVTKNLGALNAVYEMELQDANSHVKAMNKFYSNVTGAMESMAQAGKDTDKFKAELSQLTTNISALNKVYGSMLTAMKG
ncbi:MAG: gliding motility protein GldL [Cyclobacteriaceae bacterium]